MKAHSALYHENIMHNRIYVTLDSNVYSDVADPKLKRVFWKIFRWDTDLRQARKRRIKAWYVRRCIEKRRVRATIAEASLASEVLPNVQRIAMLLATGTKNAVSYCDVPEVNSRRLLIGKLFSIGIKVLHGSRISYGQMIGVDDTQWAGDEKWSINIRQEKFSSFIRHFNDYPLQNLRDLGERAAIAHGIAVLRKR